MRNERRTHSTWQAMLLGLLLCTGLAFPGSAVALRAHPFLETFGSVEQPSFLEPEGMAVDRSTGDLLVIDGDANTISRYNADGTPANFSALGTNVIDGEGTGDETPEGGFLFGGPGEVQVAVDNSSAVTSGDIYVTQASAGVVDIFGEDGSYLGQLTASSEGDFSEPCGVAVDRSGDVYVGDFAGSIHKFEPTANPPVTGDNDANFSFSDACAIAAGSGATEGFIFATHFGESVAKLDSNTGEVKYQFGSESTTTPTVDPASGHVFTAQGAEVREFDASGASSAGELSSTPLGSEATGVSIEETSGNIYVTHVGVSSVEILGPLAAGFPLGIKKGPGDGSGTVESTTPRGISCGPSCTEASDLFSAETIVELVAEAAPGSKFVGWTALAGGAGTCVGTNSPCQVFLRSARELQAEFALPQVPEVTEINPAKGPIAGGNLVEIAGTGFAEATQVEFGEVVISAPLVESTDSLIKVEAPPHNAGVVDVVVTNGDGPSVTAPGDQYTYVPTNVLTVTRIGTGSGTVVSSPAGISCGSECAHPFTEGDVVKLSATADSGSSFAGWSGACSGVKTCEVRMSVAKSVSAKFSANPPRDCHRSGHSGPPWAAPPPEPSRPPFGSHGKPERHAPAPSPPRRNWGQGGSRS
jgi:hypothetical protein